MAVSIKLLETQLVLINAYNPRQPRVPAGSSKGGQFGKGGGGNQSDMPQTEIDEDGTVRYGGVSAEDWETWTEEGGSNINLSLLGEPIKGRSWSSGDMITEEDDKKFKQIGEDIQKAASKYHTDQTVLYRGANAPTKEEALARYKEGEVVKSKTLISTSPDQRLADVYAKGFEGDEEVFPIMIEYRSPTGHRGIFAAPTGYADPNLPTGECIMPQGSTHVVKMVKDEGSMVRVIMEPVGKSKLQVKAKPKISNPKPLATATPEALARRGVKPGYQERLRKAIEAMRKKYN